MLCQNLISIFRCPMKRKPKFLANDFRMTPNVEDAARQVSWARGLKGENIPHDISINISGNTRHKGTHKCVYSNAIKFFEHRLGSDRGFGKPYRARPDRCFSIDEDEDGPRYPEDYFWKPVQYYFFSYCNIMAILWQYHGNIMPMATSYLWGCWSRASSKITQYNLSCDQ